MASSVDQIQLRHDFLEGMSRVRATVCVVTTDGGFGRAGITVSAMTSLSLDTPTPSLLICINQLSPACQAITGNEVFCVNVLRDDQSDLSDVFAGRIAPPGQDKFTIGEWTIRKSGAPVLANPVVAFDCTLRHRLDWGSHRMFIGELVDLVLGEYGSPLIYADRTYGRSVPLPLLDRDDSRGKSAAAMIDLGGFTTSEKNE
ncbi:MAG: flavin reductase family protein [Pseudomonadota bacterium]